MTYRKLFAGVLVASLAWSVGQAVVTIAGSFSAIMTMYWLLN